MPIKHFDGYLTERKHLQTHPLSILSDSRLGIDASFYLGLLNDTPPSREPLLAATGGLPLALTQRIESDLRALEKLRIKPVFVFPGLVPNRRFKQHQHHEQNEACRDRREAWTKYEAGQEEASTKLFEGRSNIHQWDLWKMVLRIFRHRNVEFIVAPYVAWAQLIYLQRHQKSYIHAIFGPTDTLLYPGVDKVITSLDLTSPNPGFSFVSKRGILNDLGVTEDQFLDIGILVGFDHSVPFPPTLHDQALKATVDMVKYYKSGHAAVSAFADSQQVKAISYPDHYARTRSMIKYSLVLSSDGTVVPLPLAIPNTPGGHGHQNHHPHHPTASDIPQDLHEIFTHRLPDEIYFYLSRGLTGPQALVWLTTGQVIENPPLDNGETTEYRRFIKEVITDGQTGPRATALALISSVAHTFWATRKVTGYFCSRNALQVGTCLPRLWRRSLGDRIRRRSTSRSVWVPQFPRN
ncbi:PIN domain-like protein [Amylocystis lapponica]|nr:PIN domain-like protein [Amylocystis lapponica]